MNRCLAFLLAVVFTTVSVSSAVSAGVTDRFAFELKPSRDARIQASFRRDDGDNRRNSWSSSFAPSDLVGLDATAFRSAVARPVRFVIGREAGRLDCSGKGGNGYAEGNCSFSADEGFLRLLDSRGIDRPTKDKAFALMAINVRREIIDAIADARYPTPTLDQLITLTAVGVDRRYISDLDRLGYRPDSLHSLVEFKALDITPAFIAGFARIGYEDLRPHSLVQFKALGVTPDYVAAFQALGYRDLPPSKLVELKALDVTPEFVRSLNMQERAPLAPGELVQRKIFSGRR